MYWSMFVTIIKNRLSIIKNRLSKIKNRVSSGE